MANTYTYKLQGDGRDSWVVEEPDGNKYMVYEDPTKDQLSLTDDQVVQLFQKFKELGLIN
jgi:hypothetical protein